MEMCKSCGGKHEPKKCMKGKSYKQVKELEKDEHQPHPGPSKSGHQKIYDAKTQGEKEAHLNTPKGDAERKAANSSKPKKMKKSLAPGMTYKDLRKSEEALMQAEAEAQALAKLASDALAQVRDKLSKSASARDPKASKYECPKCDEKVPHSETAAVSFHKLYEGKPEALRMAIKAHGQDAQAKVCKNCANLFKDSDS